jgi:hypothetical protein
MKMAEIREQYKGEWVLIKFGSMADLTEELEVIEGEVVAHALSRDEIYRVERQVGPGNYALEFLGDFPMDFLRAFDIAIHVRRGYIEVE